MLTDTDVAFILSRPRDGMIWTDLKKTTRQSPRNFAAMNDATVIVMAVREFGTRFDTKEQAVAKLRTLPIAQQHMLNKTVAQKAARELGMIAV